VPPRPATRAAGLRGAPLSAPWSPRLARLPPRPCGSSVPRLRFPQVHAALFDPPPFNPGKLSLRYLPGITGATAAGAAQQGRRYTLTHNDLTGNLTLSIGWEYNRDQLDGWYTRILRDEVLAEWRAAGTGGAPGAPPSLHVYCHVSGEEGWPAPPSLRSFIFQREMTLVLDAIAYAERELLAARPEAATAPVYVHLDSDMAPLNRVVEWGQLGDRSSWQKAEGGGVLRSLLAGLFPPPAAAAPLQRPPPPAPQQPLANGAAASGGSSSGSGAPAVARRAAPRVDPAPWPAELGSGDGLPGLAAVEAALTEAQRPKRTPIK
jgi:hypothetical protein